MIFFVKKCNLYLVTIRTSTALLRQIHFCPSAIEVELLYFYQVVLGFCKFMLSYCFKVDLKSLSKKDMDDRKRVCENRYVLLHAVTFAVVSFVF